MSKCPCGSGKAYTACCEPFIMEEKFPETAEELLRSRYSAFVKNEVDYIYRTIDEDKRTKDDLDAAKEWAEHADWKGLEILNIENGKKSDSRGDIEFVARFNIEGKPQEHFEHSVFIKKNNRWVFTEAQPIKTQTVVRTEQKVGRNDPCPCGSGKKYKKCCGKNS